jgi:hypothetical protein
MDVGRSPRHFYSCGVGVSGLLLLPKLSLPEVLFSSYLHSFIPMFMTHDGGKPSLVLQYQTTISRHLK